MEPATAAGVHHALGLSPTAMFLDVSNACLGLLNGMLLLAEGIEAGAIKLELSPGPKSAARSFKGQSTDC